MGYTPGIYDGVSNSEYHIDAALGSSSLKTLATRTPAHWKFESEHPVHKEAYDVGTAVHELVLEGEFKTVVELEYDSYRTKAAQGDRDKAYTDGLTPMLSRDLVEVHAIAESVMRNPLAANAFTGHIAEQSFFWEEEGQMYKVRPDARKQGLIVDLKTCQSASPNDFPRTGYDFGYFISAAMYVDGVKELTGEDHAFAFVNVEKSAPYLTSVTEFDAEALAYGRQMIARAKRIFRECKAADKWPGYPAFTTVSLPKWATYQLEDMMLSE